MDQMDEHQRNSLLQAIAISSVTSPAIQSVITPASRRTAFTTLEQFKTFNGRVPVALTLIQTEQHSITLTEGGTTNHVNITAPTKLYALGILQTFLASPTGYSKLNVDADRLAIRHALLSASRQIVAASSSSAAQGGAQQSGCSPQETRYVAIKLSALLADLAVRDFPQRWTTFISDLFIESGLWISTAEHDTDIDTQNGRMIGVKLCLECLAIITENCTDGDFNSKISTKRRNDVLIGLNEVQSQFIPLIFDMFSKQYSIISNTKERIAQMQTYLVQNGRTLSQMAPEEQSIYDANIQQRDRAGKLVFDCLSTLKYFCECMPPDWMFNKANGCDYISAFLHLLRETTADLQLAAVSCLDHLVQRKMEHSHWLQLLQSLPGAISEASEVMNKEDALLAAVEGRSLDNLAAMVEKFEFHRALSKMASHMIQENLAHISTDKTIIKERKENFQVLSTFLSLLTDMMQHPSGRICCEQLNAWTALLRDPQISKSSTGVLKPFLEQVLMTYVSHLIRIRWEDVEEQTHPITPMLEVSWDDKEEYDTWNMEFRSKVNALFKMISSMTPKVAATVIHRHIHNIFTTYVCPDGSSQGIRDHLDQIAGQVTQQSTVAIQLEGINQPLDNILQGMPAWALDNDRQSDPSFMDPNRVEVRRVVRSLFSEIAHMILSWEPTDIWLKFRRSQLLDSIKMYWKYDPSTLSMGIETLMTYLGAIDLYASPLSSSYRDDITSLQKKSGMCLISVSKKVNHLLVTWLGGLSERVKQLLSSDTMHPTNKMHLFEFLSCVAAAVEDPTVRSNFIADVLSISLNTLESPMIQEAVSSCDNFLAFIGVSQAATNPSSVTDPSTVEQVSSNYVQLFSSMNQLLSVGKRCHEASRNRPNGGLPVQTSMLTGNPTEDSIFPDEGSVGFGDLVVNDPFVPLWPRIFPTLLQVTDIVFTLWQPRYQGALLKNPIQRYMYAISDDEAYLAKNQGSSSNGGVFGEGGTAGSVVSGCDRRDKNLVPRWSGWLNELRNTCFQMLGLIAAQRALYAPELSAMYQNFVNIVASPDHLRAMEHRHMSIYVKQFIDFILLSCPSTLYQTHLAPVVSPFFEHIRTRLQYSWMPITGGSSESTDPVNSSQCDTAADLALRSPEQWFISYYARGGLFVGDLDAVIAEAASDKVRVELSRCFGDTLQSALALKGDWALVLANQAREEQALKRKDSSILRKGPKTKQDEYSEGLKNADGTARTKYHMAIEARKTRRIRMLCHFLLLENQSIAANLILGVSDCLSYPDAYTSRRCTKLCHRILECVAWNPLYTEPIVNNMLTTTLKLTVTEPKWMVGLEWDMINITRDICCRLMLGQTLQFGGQGAAMQQPRDSTTSFFEQSKTVDTPLQGGGVLCMPSELPRKLLGTLPGSSMDMVLQMEQNLTEKRAAKKQKDILRDFLRIVAEALKTAEGRQEGMGILDRATSNESFLHQSIRQKELQVPELPEKLMTKSMYDKQNKRADRSEVVTDIGSIFKLQ